MEEIWKDIKGYEGIYQVSNLGKVKSLNWHNNGSERLMTEQVSKDGYHKVRLFKKKTATYVVSRLVAQAFPETCGEMFEYCEIDHINGNKDDNRSINLRVCSHAENMQYNTARNAVSKAWKDGKMNSKKKQVVQLSLDNTIIKVFESISSASRETGFSAGNICWACKGIIPHTNGYKFRYN